MPKIQERLVVGEPDRYHIKRRRRIVDESDRVVVLYVDSARLCTVQGPGNRPGLASLALSKRTRGPIEPRPVEHDAS